MSKRVIYISNSGSDSTGDGSQGSPYATITKAQSLLQDNMNIYLEKGSIFYNQEFDFSGFNNILLDAYGSGDNPIISGLTPVSGWTDEGSNIWSNQDSNFPTEITNVLIGGLRKPVARNASRTSTAGSATSLTDTGLTNPDGYWDGAELVIAPYQWTKGIVRVTSYASKIFTYVQGYYNYSSAASMSYWIQNHRNCLTTQDTWAYNSSTKTLYIYSTIEPANVTSSYGTNGIYGDGSKYITIKNITINGMAECGIRFENSSNCIIEDVNLNYSGIYAIHFHNCNGIKIIGCIGLYQNNDFIDLYICRNILIKNNIGRYCGIDAGSARYLNVRGPGGTAGLQVHQCKNITIKNNEIGWTGYSAIAVLYINKFNISENYVHDFNLTKYDGGGIYVVFSGRHFVQFASIYPVTKGSIYKNISLKGNSAQASYSIYADNNSQEVEISNNVASGGKYNYHLHDVGIMNVHDNAGITEDNATVNLYLSLQSVWDIKNQIINNTLISNISQAPGIYIYSENGGTQTIKDNTYLFPGGGKVNDTANKINRIDNSYFDITEWIADEGRIVYTRTGETESEESKIDTGMTSHIDVVYYIPNTNDSDMVITIDDLPYDDYTHLDGSAISYPYTIDPHTVLIVIRKPKPEYLYAVVTGDTAEMYFTINLDESSVPATSAFTNTGNPCNNVAISGNVLTLTFDAAITNTDIDYTKPGSNPLKSAYGDIEVDSFVDEVDLAYVTITSKGDGTGVSYMRLASLGDVIMTLDGDGYFVDNYAGDNPVQTKTITGDGAWKDFYVMCTSGVSNLRFDKIERLSQWKAWSNTYWGAINTPILGGDLTKARNIFFITITGNQTITCDVSKLKGLKWIQNTSYFTGSIDNLPLLEEVITTSPLTCSSVIRATALNYLSLGGSVLSEASVNQILSDMWDNRDALKNSAYTQRVINIYGAAGTSAPTGQGLIDKANLQAYRSPLNSLTNALWTVTTR